MNNVLTHKKVLHKEVDRISRLPDDVLTHILSFLSTKEAVQTCVLSKRWKNTWAAVPILDIKMTDFVEFGNNHCIDKYNCYGGGCYDPSRMSVARFERFMTGFLDNRVPTNLKRVCCYRQFHCWETHAFMGWLDRVLLLMPLQIDILIDNWTDNSLDLPDLVFSCASLQHLWMPFNTKVKTIIRPVSINLPSLKSLELSCVELHDDFAQKLFMGCPSLERLELCGCDLYLSGISSQVLKDLTLDSCDLYEQMQISCPHLVSLCTMINLKRDGISLKNMSSLVNVDIELYLGDDVPNLNLLGSLSNAAKLELYLGTPVLKEQLKKDIPNCKNFNNLKKLVVGGWDMSNDFYLIACLLKRSPNLKKLSLLLDEGQGQIQEPRQDVSGDVLFQYEYLETVKIGPENRREYGYKLSSKLINAMVKTLDRYVKKIGHLIIA